MRQKIHTLASKQVRATAILAFMLLPMFLQAQQRQQYQQVNDIPYTASSDAYAQERCKLDVYYPTNKLNKNEESNDSWCLGSTVGRNWL